MNKPKSKPPQFVELNLFGHSPTIHCPVCGRDLFESEEQCAHVLLISEDSITFGYVRSDLEDIAKALEEEGERPSELAEKVDPERTFFLSIEVSGVGCGPFSITRLVGFEFPCAQS